ncbi:MAG: acyl-ACP thioesterase [Maricaulaceae bacterium]
MTGFIETWTGEAEAHECDALGHLNMRHYLYKAQQARQMFIMMLGLPKAFTKGYPSSVKFMDAHIQYKTESRPGQLLRIETGLVKISDFSMTLLHVIYHADSGAVSATIIENIEHVYLPTGQSFNWPKRVMESAQAYHVDMPNYAAPRSLDLKMTPIAATQMQLGNWGVKPIGRGVFQRTETDMFGRVMGAAIMGRVSDCVAHYKQGWPEVHDKDVKPNHVMGILLETRFICHTPVSAGMPFVFYSAVADINRRTRRLVHTMINPFDGTAIASMDAIAALFDLEARKIIEPTPDVLQHLQARVVPQLIA